MAITISASNRLHRTYIPVDVAAVRDVDEARKVARERSNCRRGQEACQRSRAKTFIELAGATGLEPVTFGVTGRTKFSEISHSCKFFCS
jgi:hypothetical protein